MGRQPVGPPESALPRRGRGHAGPNGFLNESWTITCTAADGTLLETNQVTVDKGQTANISLCTQGGVGGTVPATLALTLGTPATLRRVHAGRGEGLHGVHDARP